MRMCFLYRYYLYILKWTAQTNDIERTQKARVDQQAHNL